MFVQLPFWLFPLTGLMALGALIALGIVLWRGDICPGQRSRITQQLFSIWVITALSLMLAVEAKAASWLIWSGGGALVLGVGLSLAQSRLEGKRSVPSTLLWLPALPLAVYGIGLLQLQGWGERPAADGDTGGCLCPPDAAAGPVIVSRHSTPCCHWPV